MNFLAHGEVARRLPGAGTDRTLGAMLPDLTHMLDFQIDPGKLPADVGAGWTCHVAVDQWFHANEHFRSDVREMSAALVEIGWPRWSAQAACHVSWELLLDGHVASTSDPSDWYAEALQSATFREGLTSHERASWDRLAHGQVIGPLWLSYKDAYGVADRTLRRLSHTRLAVPFASIADLSKVLESRIGTIGELADSLLSSAVSAVIAQ